MRHHVHALRAGVAAGLLAAASSTAQTVDGPEGRRGMAAFVRSSTSAVVLPSGRTPFDLPTGSGQPRAVSRVRVWTYMAGTIDPADRDRWTQVADALLEPAGVIVDWHLCDGPGACTRTDGRAPSVIVILKSGASPTCGLTAFGPDGRSATVMVSVACVAAKTLEMQLRQRVRSRPLLATLAVRHLLGAVLAHEIGHVLGLKHAATGLMRAGLEIDGVVDLLAGRLAFSSREATRMRASQLCIEQLSVAAK